MADLRVSRNAPCPCGSGLKFKRCCLRKKPKGSRYEWPDAFAPRDVHSDGASLSPPRKERQAKTGAIERVWVEYTFPEQFGDANIGYSFPVDRAIVLEGGTVTTAAKLTVGARFIMQHGEIATVKSVDPPEWWEPPSDRFIDGHLRANRVVGKSERIGNAVIDLSFGGQTITTTPGHLFYSASRRKYVPAEQLEVGELLETQKGGTVALESKSAPRYGLLKLYNIEVEPNHNFFVGEGDSAVLVHNGVPGAADSGIPQPAEAPSASASNWQTAPFEAITALAAPLDQAALAYADATFLGGWGTTVAGLGFGASPVIPIANEVGTSEDQSILPDSFKKKTGNPASAWNAFVVSAWNTVLDGPEGQVDRNLRIEISAILGDRYPTQTQMTVRQIYNRLAGTKWETKSKDEIERLRVRTATFFKNYPYTVPMGKELLKFIATHR